MKQDGVLINVARGPIVDENALWQTLQGEQIGASAGQYKKQIYVNVYV